MRPGQFELGPFQVKSWRLMVAIACLLDGFVPRNEVDRLAAHGETADASSSA